MVSFRPMASSERIAVSLLRMIERNRSGTVVSASVPWMLSSSDMCSVYRGAGGGGPWTLDLARLTFSAGSKAIHGFGTIRHSTLDVRVRPNVAVEGRMSSVESPPGIKATEGPRVQGPRSKKRSGQSARHRLGIVHGRDPHGIFGRRLHAIHRCIGLADEVFLGDRVRGIGGDAETGGDGDLDVWIDVERTGGHGLAHAVCDSHGLILVGLREDDAELVAAETHHLVDSAHRGEDPFGHFLQRSRAGEMP